MNRIDFSKQGGFPFAQNTLNFMQESYLQFLNGLATAWVESQGHNYLILSGCEENNNVVGTGICAVNGEIFYCSGGSGTFVRILETSESVIFENGQSHPVYFTRVLAFQSGTGQIPWSDFVRVGTCIQSAKVGSENVTKVGTQLQLPAYPTVITKLADLTEKSYNSLTDKPTDIKNFTGTDCNDLTEPGLWLVGTNVSNAPSSLGGVIKVISAEVIGMQLISQECSTFGAVVSRSGSSGQWTAWIADNRKDDEIRNTGVTEGTSINTEFCVSAGICFINISFTITALFPTSKILINSLPDSSMFEKDSFFNIVNANGDAYPMKFHSQISNNYIIPVKALPAGTYYGYYSYPVK